jgi:hypothetical protein
MTGPTKNIIVRAYELASESRSVPEVASKLRAEGYTQVDAHLSGKLLRSQIVQRLLPSGKKRRVR